MKKSFHSVAFLAVCAILIACAGPALAQAEKSADELGPVAAWVLKDGLEKTLDESIALRLGLGESGVEIRHKGYRTSKDDVRHAFQIMPKGNVIVMSHLDADNNGYIWRTTRAGVLLMSLKRDGAAMKVVPGSQTKDLFEAEKKYFLSKIPLVAQQR